jgi:hypothetical protein
MDKVLDVVDKLDNQCLIAIVIIVTLMLIANRNALKHSEKIAKMYTEAKK